MDNLLSSLNMSCCFTPLYLYSLCVLSLLRTYFLLWSCCWTSMIFNVQLRAHLLFAVFFELHLPPPLWKWPYFLLVPPVNFYKSICNSFFCCCFSLSCWHVCPPLLKHRYSGADTVSYSTFIPIDLHKVCHILGTQYVEWMNEQMNKEKNNTGTLEEYFLN